MTRKKTTASLGKALAHDRKQKLEKLTAKPARHEDGSSCSRSVLEQNSLEELIATVELRKEEYADLVGDAEVVQQGPVLLSAEPLAAAERGAEEQRELMSIPRRPVWKEDTTAEEMEKLEFDCFTEWRRNLAQSAQEGGLFLTPYERNLDFWRQLWRCVERSDLLVQIVDARDPDFYFCRDLARYVVEVDEKKRLMLLVNKADFLSAEQRRLWAEHFASRGIDAIFFSALCEVQKHLKEQQLVMQHQRQKELERKKSGPPEVRQEQDEGHDEETAPHESGSKSEEKGSAGEMSGSLDAKEQSDEEQGPAMGSIQAGDFDVADSSVLLDELLARLPASYGDRRGTVGFVGYPNVGKSTVINALVGSKKVGMSRTPGKTKHIQTLELPAVGMTLCDCPGLVFPSVVATRAHLVINNTVPLDDLRECFSPVGLIVEKVGFAELLRRYSCKEYVRDAAVRSGDHVLDSCHSFLAALAVSRNHFLRVGVPDENWAARKVLRDYVCGHLLHCELPPPVSSSTGGSGCSESRLASEQPARCDAGALAVAEGCEEALASGSGAEEEHDDFDDLDSFLASSRSTGTKGATMTKRKMRYLNKQILKGVPVGPSSGNALRVSGRNR